MFIKESALSALLGTLMFSLPVNALELVDLGANVDPHAINNNGTVVGARYTDLYPTTAFRWTSEGFTDLSGTSANAINDNEEIVGTTATGSFYCEADQQCKPIGDGYYAYAINADGKAAGYKVGVNPFRTTPLPLDPAIYDPAGSGKWSVLEVAQTYPRGRVKGAYADLYSLVGINDEGYAVGRKSRYGLYGVSGIMTTPAFDAVTFLSVPNGGTATAINNNGLVVGTTQTNTTIGDYAHAYLYDGTTFLNLETLPSDGAGSPPGLTSAASDINDLNQVVGNSWLETSLTSIYDPTKYHAFLWEDGVMIDLNESVAHLTDASGWILTSARAINDQGDIVGTGLKDGISHGYVLFSGQSGGTPNQPPVAVATSDGVAKLTVYFNGSASFDPEGDELSYAWDFGDGSALAADMSPKHRYKKAGTYLVTLTVTDEQGLASTDQLTISVERRGK
jgi:probable HAF family extracellular repeat protein